MMLYMAACKLLVLVKQSSGACAVQYTYAVSQDFCMYCLHACFDSKPVPAQKGCSLEQQERSSYTWLPPNLMVLVKQNNGQCF